ncbi:MAG TPA: amidophosphoribosyltransferase, partial [Lachnospiraceae bacterium]|nr:amidophosphoribosyltransferase [Lachnospiraceae bacterium]
MILKDIVKSTGRYITGIVYPERCPLCGRTMYAGSAGIICQKCYGKAEYTGDSVCMKCGKPVSEDTEFCMDCTGKETSFICGKAVFVYNQYLQKSMAGFKYYGRAEYGRFYAMEMFKKYESWIRKISPDALIPVPVHEDRRLKRGYNQAEIIAGWLGEMTGIQVVSDMVIRKKHTNPQKELSNKERRRNLYGAFDIVKKSRELYPKIKCVIIIDDI